MSSLAQREERSSDGREPARAWAVTILVLGLLLVSWPFVRTPPLPLAPAYAHLLGAWVGGVGALAAMARALRPRRGPGPPDA
ncbi:conserved hypothetical protein [Anaeromyxobacter sp. K]|uniref:Uncharacterized protein n=1 Tax=Anaeromyxobacter dehalogenans (strain ATCC BAA-258 / DSM 21875 / 2CP-1) TaxID=455488 RepID=B8JFF0_ANAD2|nr:MULTISPECIES: hypothetical protein [Anaeromyxobacter]ACG74123.1 conserved hypothetical protein [Anaeromyxobacter sp. K]ACL66327.1 conserved hypothetical protein [Anaeromyxobacter dehalogenans 2CP-1]